MSKLVVVKHWDKKQVRDFVHEVKHEAGSGWAMLGPRFQEALIAERALYVLGGQFAEVVAVDAIHELVRAMLVEAGLREEKNQETNPARAGK
jgi:hypothetical protein